MRKILLVCMAVFIVAISGCENASSFSESNKRRPNYNIEYYLDTIYGNVLISTICHNNSDLSISTTLVGKVDTGDSIGINVPPVSERNVPPSAERNVPLVSD